MAGLRKFTFDTVFDDLVAHPQRGQAEHGESDAPQDADAQAEIVEAEPPAPTFSEEEMAAARAQAYAEGRRDGAADANAAIEAQLSQVLAHVEAGLADISAQARQDYDERLADTVHLAEAIARKVVATLSELHPHLEIEAMVADCLSTLFGVDRVTVRVAESVVEPLSDHMESLRARAGFAGEIEVVADPALAATDARIDWRSGRAEREEAALWSMIDETIAQHLRSITRGGERHDAVAADGDGEDNLAAAQ